MTNYIEEMMKTAGVKEIKCPNDNYDEYCIQYEKCENAPDCNIYPDFTPEKQLEIIKLIEFNDNDILIYREANIICISSAPHTYKYGATGKATDFTQALAQLTTELMRTGELDEEKVKEILEG